MAFFLFFLACCCLTAATVTATATTPTWTQLQRTTTTTTTTTNTVDQRREAQQPKTRRRGGRVVGNLRRSTTSSSSSSSSSSSTLPSQNSRDRNLQNNKVIVNSTTLPWGDVNVISLTDVHSWVGGHGEKLPDLDADYGDVLSFYQRLKQYSIQEGYDLWFVVNGDWIDGTGLAMNGDPSHLIPLLEKMPWDAVNIGNHELYRKPVIDYMTRPGGFVEWWGDKYLSSNIVYSGQKSNDDNDDDADETEINMPVGNPYRFLKGKHHTVLCFGFLFDMTTNDPTVTVKPVETVVQEFWFLDALQQRFDAILVLAHMDARDDLVTVILQAIRTVVGPDMPVQFITGHTHHRDYNQPDALSASMEGGCYLDTIGFVSFPVKSHILASQSSSNSSSATASTAAAPAPSPAPAATGSGGGGNRTLAEAEVDVPVVHERRTQTTNETMESNATTTDAPTTNSSTSSPANVAVQTNTTNTNTTTSATAAPVVQNSSAPATTATAPNPASALFQYVYMNASVAVLANVLGLKDPSLLATPDGAALSRFIFRTQEEMGLHQVIGCVKQSYFCNRSLADSNGGPIGDSLWELFRQEVVPFNFHGDEVLLFGKGTWRYDLLGGDVTVDNIIQVSPFNETMYMWRHLPSEAIQAVVDTLNNASAPETVKFLQALPMYILSPARPPFVPRGRFYDLVVDAFHVPAIQQLLNDILFHEPTTTNSTSLDDNGNNSSLSDENGVSAPTLDNPADGNNNDTLITQTKESKSSPFATDPVLIRNGTITTTGIWMDWIQSDPLCKTKNKGLHGKHKTGVNDDMDKNGNNKNNNKGKDKGSLQHSQQHRPGYDPELGKKDIIRLCFVGIAAVIVVTVLAILVYDRNSKWKLECALRDAATANAMREYEDNMEEESDGVFVQQGQQQSTRRRGFRGLRRKRQLVATADLDDDVDDNDNTNDNAHNDGDSDHQPYFQPLDPVEIHSNGNSNSNHDHYQQAPSDKDHPDMINMDDMLANFDSAAATTHSTANGTFT